VKWDGALDFYQAWETYRICQVGLLNNDQQKCIYYM
jgi:hypothetical protein